MPQGTITSKNYPNPYPHNTDCTWNIRVATGRTVAITFEDFNIERHTSCNFDYVAVYDGPDSNATQLMRTCGNTLPNNGSAIHSSANEIFVRMRSDPTSNARGFKASYITGECVRF